MKMNGSCSVTGAVSTNLWQRALAWLGLVPPAKASAAARHLTLNQGAFRQFEAQRYSAVECHTGIIWVTETGREKDLVLQAGQRCRLAGSGLVLVQAMTPAQVTLHA
jgi:hypothetical protein